MDEFDELINDPGANASDEWDELILSEPTSEPRARNESGQPTLGSVDSLVAATSTTTTQCSSRPSSGLASIVRRKGKGKGRGGGRPRGSKVSRPIWEKRKTEAQEVVPFGSFVSGAVPGSIEYARQALARKRAERENLSKTLPNKVTLSQECQDELSQYGPITDMFMIGSDLHQDFVKCISSATNADYDSEDALLKHIQTTPMSTMSLKAVEEKTKQTHVGQKILTIAAAILELSFYMWGVFLCIVDRLCKSTCKPILLLVKLRYDETPTKVRVEIPGKKDVRAETADAEEVCKSLPVQQSSNRAKVFQSELSVGCLVKSLSDADPMPYKWICGTVPTSLQCLQDGSGESIRSSLRDIVGRIPDLDRVSRSFPIALRHSCTDRYTGNFKAESLLNEDFPEFTNVHFTCSIHKLYSVIEDATGCMDYDVSGILSIGVGISSDIGCVKTMHQIVTRLLVNRLVIYYQEPPAHVAAYREHLLDLFIPLKKVQAPGKHLSNRQALQRRYILRYFLNGDWSQKELQHYCAYSCCSHPSSTYKFMATFVTWALVPRKCPKFARSRWTNWIESIEWCGLLAGVHNLLEEIIATYTGSPDNAKPKGQSGQSEDAVVGSGEGELALDDFDLMAMDFDSANIEFAENSSTKQQCEGSSGTELPELPNVCAAENPEETNTSPQAFDWKEWNRKQRGNAREWVSSQPFPRLLLLREVSGILMHLMYRFLALGGTPWENLQQSKSSNGLQREYVFGEAAMGKDVQRTVLQLHELFTTPIPCLPNSLVTIQLKAMRFRIISCALSSLHTLLRLPRQTCPYSLFNILQGHPEKLAQIPSCMWDSLTHLICTRYEPWQVWQTVASSQDLSCTYIPILLL